MGEQRPLLEAEDAAGAVVLFEDLGADDVRRHQVGRELHPLEAQMQRVAEGAHHERLGEPRHAFEQAMAAGEQTDEQVLDRLLLADDHLPHLGAQGGEAGEQQVDVGLGDRRRAHPEHLTVHGSRSLARARAAR